jgi:predicted AlkP superfamily pyrophosphatase or phosphodiesterase
MRKLFFVLALLVLSFPGYSQSKNTPYVILVSFDGFRADYVERFDLPNFKSFIRDGASAEGLIPSFPSKTFPNHYTLVTGLYPGHHGLVDNYFYDPAKKTHYGMRIKEAVIDPYYYGGTPLWILAKNNGIRSASYFWVGSEIRQTGYHPDYFFEYNESVPFRQRTDQVMSWLRLPEEERPHLITLYFSSPDTESHKYGPLAAETMQTLLRMDSLLGDFMQNLKRTKLPVNVILVSDHGMKELEKKEGTYIFLDEYIVTKNETTVVNGGTQAHIYTDTQARADSLYKALKLRAKDFSVLKRKDFPSRWNYDHERSGDILILAHPGKYIMTGDRQKISDDLHQDSKFGVHGYDPDEVKEMNGIFYAHGPNIHKGIKIKAFRNIHVYPLVAEILGLKTPKIDGEFSVVAQVYKK